MSSIFGINYHSHGYFLDYSFGFIFKNTNNFIVKQLIEYKDLLIRENHHKETPLQLATKNEHREIVQVIQNKLQQLLEALKE